jgi:hypothetical protein
MDSQLLKLTGLWKSETKNGSVMLKGSIRPGLSLVVLRNDKATGNQPEYSAFLAPSTKQEDGASDDQAPAGAPF